MVKQHKNEKSTTVKFRKPSEDQLKDFNDEITRKLNDKPLNEDKAFEELAQLIKETAEEILIKCPHYKRKNTFQKKLGNSSEKDTRNSKKGIGQQP